MQLEFEITNQQLQRKELKTLVDGILETMDCEYLISDENRYIGG